MSDLIVTVMFFSTAILIIASLILEFRGARPLPIDVADVEAEGRGDSAVGQ